MRWQIAVPANAHVPAPNQALLDVLRCPICKGIPSLRTEELVCPRCQRTYPIVLGIPDLRIYEDPLISLRDNYRKGEKIQAQADRLTFEELV